MNHPTTIVIFGATGDLSRKKLLPALFDLFLHGMLPDTFRIVGFAHTRMDREGFLSVVREAFKEKKHAHRPQDETRFLRNVFYVEGDFQEEQSYAHLADFLFALDQKAGQCSNKLFYIATPPSFYEALFRFLADPRLAKSCGDHVGWTRVLVEKPFGRDSKTAQKLDDILGGLFQENQIFRIDHYLAKETVQNILTFRFSNILFEPIWNSTYIEKVHIALLEKEDVGRRKSFYADIGALRDVGQNHMLQMLALVAMENPGELKSEHIREQRARVLESLKVITQKQLADSVARGQYKGFDGEVETYFHVRAEIDTKRWKGVPFYLESGKGLSESKVEISVYFKKTDSCLCPPEAEQHHQNVLTFRVQPDAGISLVFWAKSPKLALTLEPRMLSFQYTHGAGSVRIPDAYEKVLYDGISGDQTLFASTQEVRAAWKFITSILDKWAVLPMIEYEKGTQPNTHL